MLVKRSEILNIPNNIYNLKEEQWPGRTTFWYLFLRLIEVIKLTKGGNVNDYLSIASYFIIKKFKDVKGTDPSGLYFNKIMFLTYKSLRNKINLKLPHCWYRYGDEVIKSSMPTNVRWNHENPDKTKVFWKYIPPTMEDDGNIQLIEKTIEELTEKYSDNVFEAVKDVYNHAPFEFQKRFLELREMLYGINNTFNWDATSLANISALVFENAFNTFPVSNFPKLRRQKELTEKAIEIILNSPNPDFNLVKDFCISFWFQFCYHLRTHKKANENVPKEILTIWRGKIEFEDLKYRRIIADLLKTLAGKYDNVYDLDILKEEIEWKNKDDQEAKKIIEDFFNN